MISRDELNARAKRLQPYQPVNRYTGTLNDPMQDAQSAYMGPEWQQYFGELQKTQEDAQNAGMRYGIDYSGFGNTRSEDTMPRRRGTLADLGGDRLSDADAIRQLDADVLQSRFGQLGLEAAQRQAQAEKDAIQQADIDKQKQDYEQFKVASAFQPPVDNLIKTDTGEGLGGRITDAEVKLGRRITMRPDLAATPADPRKVLETRIQRLPANHPLRMQMEKSIAADDAAKAAEQLKTDTLVETNRHNLATERTAADALKGKGADKPATGAERQTLAFFNRAKEAAETVVPLEDAIGKMSIAGQTRLQYAPNWLQSPENQSYRQAQRAFTEARLRKESGAAIPESEFENDSKTYFAQPGDTPAQLEQKRKSRQTLLDGLAFSSGKAYDEFYGEPRNAPASDVIYARDADGNIHQAKRGTALPKGWQETNAPGGGR